MYIIYVYAVLTLVMPWKPRNVVINTTVAKLFLFHMYYYSIFIVVILLDMTSQMLHCTLAMYTTKHAFRCFFSMKNTTLIVYITEFSQKNWGGGQMHYWPPQSVHWEGPCPPGPPVADPMIIMLY